MSQTVRSRGFAALEVLAITLAVAVLSVGGWYVWHKSSPATAPTAKGNTTGQSTNKPVDPSEGGKYLVIEEWGVRFPLPPDLRGDVEYGLSKNVNLSYSDEPLYGQVVDFASKKLAALAVQPNHCGLEPGAYNDRTHTPDPTSYSGGPGISLSRSAERAFPQNSTDHLVGDYWYKVIGGQSGMCYAGSDGGQESAFKYAIATALRGLVAVPNPQP